MPAFCAIKNCGNRSERDIKSFFRLPSILTKGKPEKIRLNEERRKRWLSAIKRADLNESKMKWTRVCEDHFITGKPADLYDVNHPDWAPSVNLGYKKNISVNAVQRHERLKKRKSYSKTKITNERSSAVDNQIFTIEEENSNMVDDTDQENSFVQSCSVYNQTDAIEKVSVHTQTDISQKDLIKLEKAYEDTVENIVQLRSQISKLSISEKTFENDQERTKYYSGIKTFKTLMIIFDFIKEFIPLTPASSLTKFQQFILTLMHLRLNLEFTDLAYRFGISKSTASRIFATCINIMASRLQDFVFWPERDDLMNKVPNSFLETFGRKVTVIIDCFEIFIERPSNLMASAQTWSNYKHHNSIKYLIGISPQGFITFISAAWGGRSSDQHIAQNCGILDNLLPGDVLLCDRGFNIHNHVQLFFAEVQMPAFTRGKKQLSAIEIEKSRNISHVRIHVERVIGNLRNKYKILHSTIPISTVSKHSSEITFIDQIVKVCCYLVNISPSVIPFD